MTPKAIYEMFWKVSDDIMNNPAIDSWENIAEDEKEFWYEFTKQVILMLRDSLLEAYEKVKN